MIRWLIVGYGRAARCHEAAIAQTDDAELAGVVTLEATASPGVPCFADLSAAIDELRPDAVVIATPHESHRELAVTALTAGIPVLCEKPVGRNAVEAAEILRAASASSTPVGVVLNQRACAHNEWIRELVAGGVFSCRAATIVGALPGLRGWNAELQQSGGGILRTVGIHYLDLLGWWFGEPGSFAGTMSGQPLDDGFQFVAHYSNDVQGGIHMTAMGGTGLGPVRILLRSETAQVKLTGHTVAELDGLPDPPPPDPEPEGLIYGPGHLRIIAESTSNLTAGDEFPVSLREVMPLLELVDEIYAAAKPGGLFVRSRGVP